jgi:hypothetical protein
MSGVFAVDFFLSFLVALFGQSLPQFATAEAGSVDARYKDDIKQALLKKTSPRVRFN